MNRTSNYDEQDDNSVFTFTQSGTLSQSFPYGGYLRGTWSLDSYVFDSKGTSTVYDSISTSSNSTQIVNETRSNNAAAGWQNSLTTIASLGTAAVAMDAESTFVKHGEGSVQQWFSVEYPYNYRSYSRVPVSETVTLDVRTSGIQTSTQSSIDTQASTGYRIGYFTYAGLPQSGSGTFTSDAVSNFSAQDNRTFADGYHADFYNANGVVSFSHLVRTEQHDATFVAEMSGLSTQSNRGTDFSLDSYVSRVDQNGHRHIETFDTFANSSSTLLKTNLSTGGESFTGDKRAFESWGSADSITWTSHGEGQNTFSFRERLSGGATTFAYDGGSTGSNWSLETGANLHSSTSIGTVQLHMEGTQNTGNPFAGADNMSSYVFTSGTFSKMGDNVGGVAESLEETSLTTLTGTGYSGSYSDWTQTIHRSPGAETLTNSHAWDQNLFSPDGIALISTDGLSSDIADSRLPEAAKGLPTGKAEVPWTTTAQGDQPGIPSLVVSYADFLEFVAPMDTGTATLSAWAAGDWRSSATSVW